MGLAETSKTRSLFVRQELGERRANWMIGLYEYDLEFKLIDLIKGHGLCRLAMEIVDVKEEDPSRWEQEIKMYNVEKPSPTTITNSWYADVCQYLEHDIMPSHLSTPQ